jgi:hypothetical protein
MRLQDQLENSRRAFDVHVACSGVEAGLEVMGVVLGPLDPGIRLVDGQSELREMGGHLGDLVGQALDGRPDLLYPGFGEPVLGAEVGQPGSSPVELILGA